MPGFFSSSHTQNVLHKTNQLGFCRLRMNLQLLRFYKWVGINIVTPPRELNTTVDLTSVDNSPVGRWSHSKFLLAQGRRQD